jgi:hypothetical protein
MKNILIALLIVAAPLVADTISTPNLRVTPNETVAATATPSLFQKYTPTENRSGSTPFQFSIYSPVELPWTKEDVRGVRFNLFYANHQDVRGLDIGFGVNRSETFKGFQIAPANIQRTTRGIGLGLLNYADEASGLHIGVVNLFKKSSGTTIALFYDESRSLKTYPQVAMLTYAGELESLQLGLINLTHKSRGVQVGLVNHADHLQGGLQIGLLNFVEGKIPLPIMRWSYGKVSSENRGLIPPQVPNEF